MASKDNRHEEQGVTNPTALHGTQPHAVASKESTKQTTSTDTALTTGVEKQVNTGDASNLKQQKSQEAPLETADPCASKNESVAAKEQKAEGEQKSEEGTCEGDAPKANTEASLLEKARLGLHNTFDKAVHFIQHGSRLDIPRDQQIHMTALLKQATRGDCSCEEEPKEMDVKEGWKEWCSLKGMSRTEAMKEYTKLLTTWKADWDTADVDKTATDTQSEEKAIDKETKSDDTQEKADAGQTKEAGKSTQKTEKKSQEAKDISTDKGETAELRDQPAKEDIKATPDKVKDAHDETLLQKTFDTVKTTFDKCAHYVQRGLNLALPQVDRSKAEALFKQATIGDTTEAEPTDDAEKQKWNSWNTLKGLDKKEAMKQYISLLTSSKTEWEECERFAKDTEKVASLMKDLDIKEEACSACHPDLSKRDRKPEAYIREKQDNEVEIAQQREQGFAEKQQ
jgi:acyl-CoA-binding protein